MFDYAARRERFSEQLAARGADTAFLPISSDLEYLTGLRRPIPNFGNLSYAHGWVAGCFLRPGTEAIFIVPRMFAEFDMEEEAPGELVVVGETDAGRGVLGVIDGEPPLGVETDEDEAARKELLRAIGYKL